MTDARKTAVAVALALLWGVGLFARNYWTPDEPREAALASSMSAHYAPLPQLAGVTFAEKPPLTYWMAGASRQLLGDSPAAVRLPQLLLALLAALSVAALARALAGAGAAWGAALIFAGSELVYQVQIWLDTDALLLAGVCVALSGMYAGLRAARGAPRLRAYVLMHVGLTLAFFAKNFAAWLVPVLAFICFVAWERRWRELVRWELYLGAVLPGLCIAFWVHAVATMHDGTQSLRILFWNNLVGRALPVAAQAQYDYANAHRNWPGKYLVEALLYLVPWTLVALAALRAAWPAVRAQAGTEWAMPWRFALCTAVPGMAVLSLAATARGIYAAPCMVGFVMLIALWAAAQATRAGASRPLPVTATAALIFLLSLALLVAVVGLQLSAERSGVLLFMCSVLCCVGAAVSCWQMMRPPASQAAPRLASAAPATPATPALASLERMGVAWALLLAVGVLPLYKTMNHAQDLRDLAVRLHAVTGNRALLLWDPDETTLAWQELYGTAGRWSAVGAAAGTSALSRQLTEHPDAVIVSASHQPGWSRTQWLAYLREGDEVVRNEIQPGAEARANPALTAAGLTMIGYVGRPGGRGYTLWSTTWNRIGIQP